MKRTTLFAVLVALLAAATFLPLPSASAQATSWKQIPIPQLPAFKPQQPKRVELSNGMVIFLQEDHELPLIDGTARIRGGSVNEPADKTGLVDILSEVWRTGGTKSQTGDQLDDFLEVRAAKVETGGGPDSTTISFSCLKGDLDDVFKAFLDVLQNPEFRAEKIEIAQKGEEDSISRRNDEVGRDCASRGRETRLRCGQSVRPRAGIRHRGRRHSPGPDRLARQVCASQQHHSRHQRRLRFGGDGSPAARGVRLVAERSRASEESKSILSGKARLLPDSQRRREPEQHPHGCSRHHARQSRLLRDQRFQ